MGKNCRRRACSNDTRGQTSLGDTYTALFHRIESGKNNDCGSMCPWVQTTVRAHIHTCYDTCSTPLPSLAPISPRRLLPKSPVNFSKTYTIWPGPHSIIPALDVRDCNVNVVPMMAAARNLLTLIVLGSNDRRRQRRAVGKRMSTPGRCP